MNLWFRERWISNERGKGHGVKWLCIILRNERGKKWRCKTVGYNFGSEPHRHAALEESLNEGATRGRRSATFKRLVKRYCMKETSYRNGSFGDYKKSNPGYIKARYWVSIAAVRMWWIKLCRFAPLTQRFRGPRESRGTRWSTLGSSNWRFGSGEVMGERPWYRPKFLWTHSGIFSIT